uniref:Uncharacterized protein n=1 Tax=Anopheles atroparvus TaxID=41427 RepID=A0AAG5DUB2_ANOAO
VFSALNQALQVKRKSASACAPVCVLVCGVCVSRQSKSISRVFRQQLECVASSSCIDCLSSNLSSPVPLPIIVVFVERKSEGKPSPCDLRITTLIILQNHTKPHTISSSTHTKRKEVEKTLSNQSTTPHPSNSNNLIPTTPPRRFAPSRKELPSAAGLVRSVKE